MSAMKSGASLRALVLTPERIPTFIIPSPRNLFMASPMFRRGSPDFSRLLSEDDDEDPSETGPLGTPTNRFSSWSRLRPHTPRPSRPRRAAAAADASEAADADTDPTTRAAMSLPHVQKLTTPYGFRGVLATTPSTNRRESLFHRSRPVKVTVNDAEPEEDPAVTPPAACPDLSGRSRVSLRPVKALGRKVMEELKKPAAALMALSPSAHR